MLKMFKSETLFTIPALRRILVSRSYHLPPSHFSDPLAIPQPFGESGPTSTQQNANQNKQEQQYANQNTQRLNNDIPPPNLRSMKDFALVFGSLTMAYLALDNYKSRVKIEKMSQETAAINVKTLQLQQQTFTGAIKKQELRIHNERMVISKRCFKMALHIAMLRKQLQALGVDPTTIDQLTEEFEKSVKMSKLGPGGYLWLDEASEYKADLPDYRDYDKKGND